MSNRNTTLYTTQAAGYVDERLEAGQIRGKLLFAESSYTMLGTEVTSDTFNICILPKGSKIIPALSHVVNNACATTATLDIGDDDVLGVGTTADADRYADGLDIAAAGTDLFNANACAANTTLYELGADSVIIGKFATLLTPVANKVITVRICYLPPQ